MSNQRAIAKALSLSQSTVSMALRGSSSIPEATRKRVREEAERMGYRPSPQISALMECIRKGRKVEQHSCIGIIVDAISEEEWFGEGKDTYRLQFNGYRDRAAQRGFRTECFFMRAEGMSSSAIDRQLYARGIEALILAAPLAEGSPPIKLTWERYAAVTISYTWHSPVVDRISSHHRYAVDQAVERALLYGYKRIGLCLPPNAQKGVDSNWIGGYIIAQMGLPRSCRLPAFIGRPSNTGIDVFKKWYERWKPDVLITLLGEELVWIKEIGLDYPRELAIICLNRSANSNFSGINENNSVVGMTASDHVIDMVTRNERGLPKYPKVILVEGFWNHGNSMPDRRNQG